MEQGVILSGVGGIYQVKTEQGIIPCTLRGRLRLADDRVLVGDRVKLTRDGEQGIVEDILPRANELTRPPIANLEQVVAVFAVENPLPSFVLLDRILVHAEMENLPSVIVFNKGDLNEKRATELSEKYQKASYRTLITSASESSGLEELLDILANKISTLVGPSGAGKSSLLNALQPGLDLQTQAVSARVQRGRHTTRTVQLIPIANGYVADTPGFSQLNITHEQEQELQYAFPEIRELIGSCRFRGCLHRKEPGCAVKEAVDAGEILAHRYEHYLLFLSEVEPRY